MGRLTGMAVEVWLPPKAEATQQDGRKPRARRRLSLRRRGARAMELLELDVCVDDDVELFERVVDLGARDGEIQLVVSQPGIHAVADAADAGDTRSGLDGVRNHRARRPPHRRALFEGAGGA